MSDFNFNLQNLLHSLQEIEKSSYAEKTVEIFGKFFTVGVLSVDEQVQIHEYCSKTTNRIAYLLNYQVEVLAHALKGIDREYFGNEKFFPTGEFDEHGNPVRKQKHVFWREIISKWNTKLRDRLYQEYDKLDKQFNQSLEESIEFIEEPQEEPPQPELPPERFRKIDEKEVALQEQQEQKQYAEGSFMSLEDAVNTGALYDEKGNLTAEGNALSRALDKIRNDKPIPGVEVRYPEELKQEIIEEPQEIIEEPQENETFNQLQERIEKSGGALVKAKSNNSLSKFTQLHDSQEDTFEESPKTQNIDQQQAAKIFQRMESKRPAKPKSRKPFELSEKELSKLSHVERMRYQIDQQKYQDQQRDFKRQDDVQLTSKSKPLLGGAPPGKEKTVPKKYRV